MKMQLQRVKESITKFDKFSLIHIPRLDNAQADSLARLASLAATSDARSIIWEVHRNASVNIMVSTINRSETWMEPLIRYLQQDIHPNDELEAQIQRKKGKWFEFYDGTLYKKSYTHPLLKCVTLEEGNYILREIHEGACGIHQGVRIVINKALKSEYYRRSRRSDAETLILRCSICQFFSKVTKKPISTSLQYNPCCQYAI